MTQRGFETATVVFWPEQSLSYRDEILFSWESLPCSTITVWGVSRGKENACQPVAGDKRQAKLATSTKQNEQSKHQRDTPSLFHTQKDFPVIQPAVVIRVSENLAEQRNTVIKINTPPSTLQSLHFKYIKKSHLPSLCHPLSFFFVNVSLYAGFSSGYENCMPESQCSQSHSHCAVKK